MTNDTSTLTGALKEAGETLAANLTTQGVPSTWDEGLTTLIGKVLNITPGPTPAFDGISLTGDKSILSYADSDSCTLTAQLLDGSSSASVSGVTVEFFNGSTSLGTAETNSSGVATKVYSSAGSGDISLTASAGTFVSETYSIEDCLKYNSSTYSANATFNYTLPSTFKIEYESLITTTSNNSCFVRVGESDSKALLTGKVGSGDSVWKVTVRTSSSGTGDIPTTGGTISLSNDWQPNTITYDGTSYKFHDITVTNLNGVSLSKLVSFATWKSGTTSGQIKNIKIKPL